LRRFRIFILLVFIACVALFIGSFVFLDSQKHTTYYYIMSLNGHDIGTIKIDRFSTDEKLLYRSSAEIPFYPVFTSFKTRMTFDKKYILESFLNEASGLGATRTVYFENIDNAISSISIADSKFTCLTNIPTKDRTFVFEETLPVTYLPIIDNFDFKRGKSQGFNAITQFSDLLVPVKRFVTLTSIKNEYIKIERRKIKTECLLLKIKNYPQGTVWVARSDRSLIMVELPKEGIKIRRTFSQKKMDPAAFPPAGDSLASRDVIFNNKNIKLAGTITSPKDELKHPAVLLIWGDGSEDRNYQGLFSSLAGALARQGFSVMAFDKRGIGASEGDPASVRDDDIVSDINAAIDFLKSQKEADAAKIALIGHAKGAFYVSRAANGRDDIKTLVFLSPLSNLETRYDPDYASLKEMAAKFNWNDDYLKMTMKSQVETLDRIRAAKRSWTSILGKHCFVEKMRDEMTEDPIAEARKVKVPVLIIHGKEDYTAPNDSEAKMERALEEGGNKDHKLIYFGYLGHFPGSRIMDGVHKIGYLVDSGVLDAIQKWLDTKFAEPDKPSKN
jgi:uncharacterized protein